MEEAERNVLVGLLLLLIGVFSAFCAAKNYDWFMGSRKARFLVKILGRRVARIFYLILGLSLAVGGCVLLLTL
ncbi:MAG: immunity 17 family protein [Synergistaceae bacterium]|jgi:hypothetical protein|nr:immunity 17 family protein [Synergistaceae bacterium]